MCKFYRLSLNILNNRCFLLVHKQKSHSKCIEDKFSYCHILYEHVSHCTFNILLCSLIYWIYGCFIVYLQLNYYNKINYFWKLSLKNHYICLLFCYESQYRLKRQKCTFFNFIQKPLVDSMLAFRTQPTPTGLTARKCTLRVCQTIIEKFILFQSICGQTNMDFFMYWLLSMYTFGIQGSKYKYILACWVSIFI